MTTACATLLFSAAVPLLLTWQLTILACLFAEATTNVQGLD